MYVLSTRSRKQRFLQIMFYGLGVGVGVGISVGVGLTSTATVYFMTPLRKL